MPIPFPSTPSMHRAARRSLLACMVSLSLAPPAWAIEPDKVPAPQRTQSQLYLEAREVPAFIAAAGGPDKVLFIDVRTRVEPMYVGMAQGIDALVPFVEHQELMSDWDDKRGHYKLEPLQDFVPEMNRRREAKGLPKDATVVLICRSGDRSSRSADRLMADGWSRVYTVVDGFEGYMSPAGRREVNGWKNAGLPWSYKLDKSKMYFAR